MRYNYVIIQSHADYYHVTWSDIEKCDNAKIYYGIGPKRGFLHGLARLQHSSKLNKFFKVPFRGIWYKYFSRIKFDDNSRETCFLINADMFRNSGNFIPKLRSVLPGVKVVGFYTDLVKTKPKEVWPDRIRHTSDLLISYDKIDAEKYDMLYYPTVFSDYQVDDNVNIPVCDVYFVGAAKNRIKTVLACYRQLVDAGLKCDFYISKVPREEQIPLEGIHYIESMSYIDNLKHVTKCRCILEIMQKEAVGSTLRMWEAINYGKAILTNNKGILESEFYDSKYVSIIDESNKCDVGFIMDYISYENPLRERIRPSSFLEFVDNRLSLLK